MADADQDLGLPVFMRVGDGVEHQIGAIASPAEMDPLLRATAAQVKQELRRAAHDRQQPASGRDRQQPAPEQDRQQPAPEQDRQQPGSPRDRQARPGSTR